MKVFKLTHDNPTIAEADKNREWIIVINTTNRAMEFGFKGELYDLAGKRLDNDLFIRMENYGICVYKSATRFYTITLWR